MANSDYSVELTAKLKWGESKKNIQEQLSQATFLIHAKLYDSFKDTIQKQLSEISFKINIGNVNFNNSGLENARKDIQQVANTTDNITRQTQQASQAVNGLTNRYAELYTLIKSVSKIEMPDISHNVRYKKQEDQNGKSTWVQAESVKYTKQQLLEIQSQVKQLEQQFTRFGTTSVKSTYDANQQLNGFVLTIKDGAKEIGNLKYSLDNIMKGRLGGGNDTKKATPILNLTGYSINDNNISRTEQQLKEQQRAIEAQNKALERQSDHYTRIKSQVDELIAKQRERKNQIDGVNTDVNGQMFVSGVDATGNLQKYANAYNNVKSALDAYDKAIKDGDLVTQDFKNTLTTSIAELRRYGENIRTAQAANVGNMGEKDVSKLVEAAQIDLQRFTSQVNMSGVATDEFKSKISSLKTTLDGVADSNAYTAYTDELRKVKAEYQQIKVDATAATQATQMFADTEKTLKQATDKNLNNNAIQSPENVKLLQAEYNKTVEAINKFKTSSSEAFVENKKAAEQAIQSFSEYIKVLQNSEQSIQATDNAIKKLQTDTSKGLFAQNSGNSEVVQLQQDITNLSNQYAQLQSRFQNEGATQEVIAGFTQLDNQIKSTSERAKELQTSLKSAKDAAALEDRKSNLNNKIETWLRNNTRASESMRQSMKSLQTQIQSADKQTLTHLTQQFNELNRTAQQTGQIGKSALDIFKEKAAKFAGWFGLANAFMMITNEGKQALVTLKDVDSILTEISKTSERSAESLEKLGETAFDAASKYGVSVQNYLTGVQEMARAGYEIYGEERSAELAELALLIQSAGDTTAQAAQEAIIATDAAFQLGGNVEELTKVFNSLNKITNNTAINMNEMAIGIKEAASIAHQYGVSIEDTASLIAIAEARTKQGGAQVGNAIKSLLVTLTDVTNSTVTKAFDAVGVSMYKFVDGSKQLKTPIELLGELSKVFNELPQGDDRRSILLNDIGGMQIYHYVQKCA